MTALSGGAPEALLFDFGGTLDSDGVAWKDRFFPIWSEEVGSLEREKFDRAFYGSTDALVGAVPPTLPLSETVDRIAAGVASRLDAGHGAPSARAAARFTRETLATLDRRITWLSGLASRYRLAIVSNFYGNLAAVCEESGIAPHFSAAIDSTAVGCTKPGPAIFRAALDALGASPDSAVFIGDSVPRDMSGARALGMRHVLLRPASSDGAPPCCCPDDPVIRRLEDLSEMLA
ncbi:MAG: HAD family hydrolase [Acidobacteriota bacterium]